MKNILTPLALFLVLLICFTAHSEVASPKNIRQLLKITGYDQMIKTSIAAYMPQLKKVAPKASDEFWEETLKETLNSTAIEEQLISVYQSHYSEEETLALISFYKSPVGVKLVTTTPTILKASREIAKTWGAKAARQMVKKYLDKYESKP